MGLIDDCRTYFGANDLYEVLSVDKSASETGLKKAYKKASLLVHPDRVDASLKEEATRKFQTLSQAYFILSDKEKRITYDETGCFDEENSFPEEGNWSAYWRLLFPKLTLTDIDNFMKTYKGSEKEKKDLKKCYLEHKGDMDKISECLIGYDAEDEERYREILNNLIKDEEVPSFPKFAKESKLKKTARNRRFKKEAAEAEELRKEMKVDESEQSLINAIVNKNKARESQFDNLIQGLESKYGKKTESGRKKRKE